MGFLDLPLKSKRAAFAKMAAADKAKKGAKSLKPKKAASKRPSASNQVSRQYQQTGKPTAADVDTLIKNYRTMHGKDPSPAQIAKLRRKRK